MGLSATEYDYSRGPDRVGSFAKHLDHFVTITQKNSNPQQPTILDYGAGTGLFTQYMAHRGSNVYAYDIAPNSMALVEPNHRVTKLADLQPSFFDAVLIKDVLEHVPDLELFFSTLAHLLKAGGLIMAVFSDVNEVEARFANRLAIAFGYYETNKDIVTTSSRSAGICFTQEGSYLPLRGEKDWYHEPRKRTILYGSKTVS